VLYIQFTRDQRIELAVLLRIKKSYAECGRQLGKVTSSISKEVERNICPDGIYRGNKAHKRAMARRKQAKAASRIIENNVELETQITVSLQNKISPEQISGRIKFKEGKSLISFVTIYSWIYSEHPELSKCLRHRKSQYRRKHGTRNREKTREQAKVKRIDERPKEVDLRTRIGDWEGDTVIGGEKTTRIVTNVERKSGYAFAVLLHTVTAELIHEVITKEFRKIPRSKRKTYTYDNGTELGQDDRGLEKKIKMDVYRAYPYHSWERGTNENWNGLLRQYFPKRMNFAKLTQADVNRAVKALNNRPRKRLGYLTPYEVFVLGKVPFAEN
jgi:transposase, IS30 family